MASKVAVENIFGIDTYCYWLYLMNFTSLDFFLNIGTINNKKVAKVNIYMSS